MIKLISIMFGTLFFASCGETEEVLQTSIGNGETNAVDRDVYINILPMQNVGGASTRSGEVTHEPEAAFTVTYGEGAMTRAQTDTSPKDGNESAINNAYILQFDGTCATSVLKTVKSIRGEDINDMSPIICDFTMTVGVKNRVYVVANLTADQIAAIDGNSTTLVTLSAFEAPVAQVPVTAVPATGLPMSAVQDVYPGQALGVFQLKSLLTKLIFNTNVGTLKLKGLPNGYSIYTPKSGNDPFRPVGMTYSNTGVSLTSGSTYYVPENLSGSVSLPSPLVRCSTFAPKNSLFVEIAANKTTYNLYLGDGSVSDFNFMSGFAYNVNATISGTDSMDLRVGTITALDRSGTANCYVVTDPVAKWYSFNGTVMGNGVSTPMPVDMSAGVASPITPQSLNPGKADVLWETVNAADAPAVGSIVDTLVYVINGQILFRSGDTTEGNAVIAARDASNNIIWSWHIWRMKTAPAGIALKTITGTKSDDSPFTALALRLMDRNLGALEPATEATVASMGFLYQWGRKDPFPGGADLASGTSIIATTNITDWNELGVTLKKTVASVSEAISNPTVYYVKDSNWTSRNDNLWGAPLTAVITIGKSKFNGNAGSKSIYDPCPVGWRVAPAYAYANITKPMVFANGFDFDGILTAAGTKLFLTASGHRISNNGTLKFVGTYGHYHSSASHANNAFYGSRMEFYDKNVYPANISNRTFGYSVRCAQE